jgi:hypothetical protein
LSSGGLLEPTSFLLGVLIASTKGLALVSLGFGIAWWRGRRRVKELEAERPTTAELHERLDRLESSLEYMTAAVERLGKSQDDLRHLLPPGSERTPPVDQEITPH